MHTVYKTRIFTVNVDFSNARKINILMWCMRQYCSCILRSLMNALYRSQNILREIKHKIPSNVDRGGTVVKCCAINRKVAGSIPAGVIGIFHWHKIRSHNGPGVDSTSNRNEYQEHLLRGKGGRCVKMPTLPPSCAVVMKSGNLNFLETSGPLQACNGTALTLHLTSNVPLLLTY